MKNKSLFFIYILIVGFALPITGALLKIMHWPIAETILIIGLCSHIPITIYALYHLTTNKNYSTTEKLMWWMGLIFLSPFILLIYLWFAPQKAELNRLREEQKLTI